MEKPTLIAKVIFNTNPTPDHFDYLKMIAEKELNRSPYLTVEIIEKEE